MQKTESSTMSYHLVPADTVTLVPSPTVKVSLELSQQITLDSAGFLFCKTFPTRIYSADVSDLLLPQLTCRPFWKYRLRTSSN